MKYISQVSILLMVFFTKISDVFAIMYVEGGSGGTGYSYQEAYRIERGLQCKKTFGDFFLCVGEDSLVWFHFLFGFDLIIYIRFFLILGILFVFVYLWVMSKPNLEKIFFKRSVKVLSIFLFLVIFLPIIFIALKSFIGLF